MYDGNLTYNTTQILLVHCSDKRLVIMLKVMHIFVYNSNDCTDLIPIAFHRRRHTKQFNYGATRSIVFWEKMLSYVSSYIIIICSFLTSCFVWRLLQRNQRFMNDTATSAALPFASRAFAADNCLASSYSHRHSVTAYLTLG